MDFFGQDDPTDEEQQQALIAALRKQQGLGVLGQLSGDKVLGSLGQNLQQGAQQGQQLAERGKERKLQLNLEAQKDAQTQQYRTDSLDDKQVARAEHAQETKLARDALNLKRQEFGAAKAQRDQEVHAVANDRLVGRLENQLQTSLQTGSWTGPIGDQVKAAFQAQHLLTLAKKAKDGSWNDLTDNEQHELAIGFNRLLSGGQGTEATTKSLIPPQNIQAGIQGIKQWFSNEPQGRNQLAFIERTGHSIERQKKVAERLVKEELAKRAGGAQTLKNLAPEVWETHIRNAQLDPAKFDEKGVYQLEPDVEADGQAPDKKTARIQELIKSGIRDPGAIHKTLKDEGLLK